MSSLERPKLDVLMEMARDINPEIGDQGASPRESIKLWTEFSMAPTSMWMASDFFAFRPG